MIEINRNTVVGELLRECPEAMEVFEKHDMPCRMCMGASTDTLEESAIMHNVDIEQIIAELKQHCGHSDS
ncbi:MAG: DUF1858 domain-containing protein [Armatimonadota bacterium]|nr:DUF1858 domain-containing protein [bacterium]